MYYYGARYYDSDIGRWFGIDPIKVTPERLAIPQGLNLYTYTNNNPLRYIDPTGMFNIETGEVEKGDTLSGITGQINAQYNTNYSYHDIAQLNNLSDPNKLQIGQVLIPNEKVPDITNKLVNLMREHAADWGIQNPWYFKDKVKDHGDWDLKYLADFDSSKYKDGFVFYAEKIRADAPGNIHYGYVGSAAWYGSQDRLLYEAGKNQQEKGGGNLEFLKTNPEGYGDDPYDTEMIKYGIQLHHGIFLPRNDNNSGHY